MKLNELMQKAKLIQKGMQQAQETLDLKTVTETAGDGSIEIVMTCRNKIEQLKISKQLFNNSTKIDTETFASDLETATELLVTAFNKAVAAAESESQKTLLNVTQDLNLDQLDAAKDDNHTE